MSKIEIKRSYKKEFVSEPIYTGGDVQITPDKQFIATNFGTEIKITNIIDGMSLFTLSLEDSESISCFKINRKGNRLVSSSRNGLLSVWNLEDGSLIRSWKAHTLFALCLDFDATDSLVASGFSDGLIRVWDYEKGFCTHNFKGHAEAVHKLLFHFDQNKWELYSSSNDLSIRVWDLISQKCVTVLKNHSSVISSIAVSPCGYYLVSAGRDKIMSTWDLRDKTLLKTLPINEEINSLGFISKEANIFESTVLYMGGITGNISLWNFDNGEQILSKCLIKQKNVALLNLMLAENQLILVSSDQNLYFLSLPKLKKIRTIVGFNDEITDLKFLGNENKLAMSTNSNDIRLYDKSAFSYVLLNGHEDVVLCLDYSANLDMLASGSKDSTVRLWSSEGKPLSVFNGHTESVVSIAFGVKTKFLLSASQDRTVKFWTFNDYSAPESHYTIKAHDKEINAIAVAPNNKMFATAAQDKLINIWNVSDGAILGKLTGHKRGVWSIQFSPIDRCLVSCSGDKTVRIWSVTDFTCLKTFDGHMNTVLKACFFNSGSQVVSSGSDGLVKVWNVKTGECSSTLDNHTDKIWALTTFDDGDLIVSGGADSVVTFWRDNTQEVKDEELELTQANIQQEQELTNSIIRKDYSNALVLSLQLDKPQKLFVLFSSMIHKEEHAVTLNEFIISLATESLEKLLAFVRDWNTNTKKMVVAQTILKLVVSNFTPDQLIKLKNSKQLIASLISYSEKHFTRATELLQDTYLIDYILSNMQALQ